MTTSNRLQDLDRAFEINGTIDESSRWLAHVMDQLASVRIQRLT